MRKICLLSLLCLLLFSGCKEFHCPAFPDNYLVLLPQLSEGEMVVYSNGEESITLFVKGYEKSKERFEAKNCDCHVCDISASLQLDNDEISLSYGVYNTTNNIISLKKQYGMAIRMERLLSNNDDSLFEVVYNNETGMYESRFNVSALEEIESIEISRIVYNNVLCLISDREDFYLQKVYYEKHNGIVRFETADGEVWNLVKSK